MASAGAARWSAAVDIGSWTNEDSEPTDAREIKKKISELRMFQSKDAPPGASIADLEKELADLRSDVSKGMEETKSKESLKKKIKDTKKRKDLIGSKFQTILIKLE